MGRRILVLLISMGLLLAVALPAGAEQNDRVTYGDVRAHFQAGEGGGSVVFRNGPPAAVNAAPGALFDHGIRPFPGSPWDGASFCEDDWHLLVLADLIAAREGEPKIKHRDGAAFINGATIELHLDGSEIAETETTAIKRLIEGMEVLEDGSRVPVHSGWWEQTGAFFAPGELGEGSHQFGAVFVVPGFGEFPVGPITFNIDASGTGSCV